jgi:hypothetical protein
VVHVLTYASKRKNRRKLSPTAQSARRASSASASGSLERLALFAPAVFARPVARVNFTSIL